MIRHLMLSLLAFVLFAAPLLAQDATDPATPSLVGSLAMESAVENHALSLEAARENLRKVLSSPEVSDVTERHGIAMNQVRERAERLSDAQVQETAPLVERALEAVEQGSRTITVSVYTVIIILLLLILLT